jgi:hypothetical protein
MPNHQQSSIIVLGTATGRPLDKAQAGEIIFIAPVLALTKSKAAEAIGCSRTTFWRLCATGQIRATPHGVVPVTELQRYLDKAIER